MPGIGTLRELCASTRYLHPKPEADDGHIRRSIPRAQRGRVRVQASYC